MLVEKPCLHQASTKLDWGRLESEVLWCHLLEPVDSHFKPSSILLAVKEVQKDDHGEVQLNSRLEINKTGRKD